MKAELDRSGCIGCSLCTQTCPKVFQMAEDGFAEVYREDVPEEVAAAAVETQNGCPVSVITVS